MARYYPHGNNRSDDYYKDKNLEENGVADWLYADDWDEAKVKEFERRYAIPGYKEYLDYLLDLRADQEYLDRYGMDYSDVHDPRKLRQVSSAARLYQWSVNFVSDNIKRLL